MNKLNYKVFHDIDEEWLNFVAACSISKDLIQIVTVF